MRLDNDALKASPNLFKYSPNSSVKGFLKRFDFDQSTYKMDGCIFGLIFIDLVCS